MATAVRKQETAPKLTAQEVAQECRAVLERLNARQHELLTRFRTLSNEAALITDAAREKMVEELVRVRAELDILPAQIGHAQGRQMVAAMLVEEATAREKLIQADKLEERMSVVINMLRDDPAEVVAPVRAVYTTHVDTLRQYAQVHERSSELYARRNTLARRIDEERREVNNQPHISDDLWDNPKKLQAFREAARRGLEQRIEEMQHEMATLPAVLLDEASTWPPSVQRHCNETRYARKHHITIELAK
ncbi:MAG: hypothetical protein SGI88_02125 [Candidatus Hydrogenedentes bacterium]|nr:hypothetical protein [Candidatus Hydrogenedentota bacterium]